jgi:hypothetical protein
VPVSIARALLRWRLKCASWPPNKLGMWLSAVWSWLKKGRQFAEANGA